MKTRKICFLGLVLLWQIVMLAADPPDWAWAVNPNVGGSTSYAEGMDAVADAAGNVYVTGFIHGTATFGSTTLAGNDAFVAKLDPAGNWLWAKQNTGGGSYVTDTGTGIALDGSGNVYITGFFTLTITFTTGISLASTGGVDVFVAKLDNAGNWLWARKAGGTYSDVNDGDRGYDIALDGSGNILVSGYCRGGAVFGTNTVTGYGIIDAFVAKMDPSGNWLWVRNGGGNNYDYSFGVDTDAAGNVYYTGRFSGTATFGPYTYTMYDTSGGSDIFAAKLDGEGNWLWAERFGGTNSDYGRTVAVDGGGNVYLSGYYGGTAAFGAYSITSAGGLDVYLAKLDSSGTPLWVRSAGGSQREFGFGIALDNLGAVYLAGAFQQTAYFGPFTLTQGDNEDEIFVAKVDSAGNWIWALRAGGIDDDTGNGVCADGSGNVYVTGSIQGPASFGTIELTTTGLYDIFVAKIGSGGETGIPVPPEDLALTISGEDVLLDWSDVTVDTAGNPVTVDHYLVYYCATGPEGPFTVFGIDGSITLSEWTHTGAAVLSPGFYYVTAVKED